VYATYLAIVIQRIWDRVSEPKERSSVKNRIQGWIFVRPLKILLANPITAELGPVPHYSRGGV
jgi:hypothetical protein